MIKGLRNLKANVAILVDRIELYSKLLAAEAKIETALVVRRLVWVGIGAVFALFAIAMAHMAIITFFWHSEFRVIAVGGILLLDVLVAGIAFYSATRPAEQESFAVTKHQLAEDMKFFKETL